MGNQACTEAEISRRSFLGGAFSFGTLALGGCAFRVPAGLLSGAGANLVFGVRGKPLAAAQTSKSSIAVARTGGNVV